MDGGRRLKASAEKLAMGGGWAMRVVSRATKWWAGQILPNALLPTIGNVQL
jgi:hypothetical protein